MFRLVQNTPLFTKYHVFLSSHPHTNILRYRAGTYRYIYREGDRHDWYPWRLFLPEIIRFGKNFLERLIHHKGDSYSRRSFDIIDRNASTRSANTRWHSFRVKMRSGLHVYRNSPRTPSVRMISRSTWIVRCSANSYDTNERFVLDLAPGQRVIVQSFLVRIPMFVGVFGQHPKDTTRSVQWGQQCPHIWICIKEKAPPTFNESWDHHQW